MQSCRDTYCKCLFYSAGALARKIARLAEHEFKPTGLSPSLGFVMMTVIRQPGISVGELAKVMQLQPSTVTRLVEKLEKGGFLTGRTKGRFNTIWATNKGKRLEAALKQAWRRLYERYTTMLGEEFSQQLAAAIYEASCQLE